MPSSSASRLLLSPNQARPPRVASFSLETYLDALFVGIHPDSPRLWSATVSLLLISEKWVHMPQWVDSSQTARYSGGKKTLATTFRQNSLVSLVDTGFPFSWAIAMPQKASLSSAELRRFVRSEMHSPVRLSLDSPLSPTDGFVRPGARGALVTPAQKVLGHRAVCERGFPRRVRRVPRPDQMSWGVRPFP